MAEPTEPVATPDPAPVSDSAPSPQYATIEDMQRIEATISGRFEELSQNFRALMERSARPVAEPPAANVELTDEQIDAAVDEGRMTRAHATRLIAERVTARLKKEHVDPLQAQGLASLASLTKQAAIPTMPHYKRFQKEIDQMIEALPAGSRLTPETYKMVHDAVVGAHVNELVDETREAAIRSAGAPKPETAAPQTRSGRTNTTGQVPTVEDLLGAEAAAAMESKGQSPDDFAKRLGYRGGWKEYAEVASKQMQGVA